MRFCTYLHPHPFFLSFLLLTSPLSSSLWQADSRQWPLTLCLLSKEKVTVYVRGCVYIFPLCMCACVQQRLCAGNMCLGCQRRKYTAKNKNSSVSIQRECVCLCAHIFVLAFMSVCAAVFGALSFRWRGLPSWCHEWWQTACWNRRFLAVMRYKSGIIRMQRSFSRHLKHLIPQWCENMIIMVTFYESGPLLSWREGDLCVCESVYLCVRISELVCVCVSVFDRQPPFSKWD